MTEAYRPMGREFNVDQIHVAKAAELGFARGIVGQRYPLATTEAELDHANQLAEHTLPLTKRNTADCGDGRLTIGLADITEDRETLRARVVPQIFGGIGLGTTKALVAANAAVVRDAKDVWQAYEITSRLLETLGEEDAAHTGCGASHSVEASVANAIPRELLVPGIGLFLPMTAAAGVLVDRNTAAKNQRLQAGFYGGWDPNKHIDYVASRFPQNFSYLEMDPDDHEAHGHNESSVYAVTHADHGFAKNAFAEDTGQQAFGLTIPKMRQLAHMLGGSDEERARILVGFFDDSLHVGGGIVTEGMPVFAEAA